MAACASVQPGADARKDAMMNAETSLEGMCEEREEERPRATNKQDQCVKQPSVNTSAVKRRGEKYSLSFCPWPPPGGVFRLMIGIGLNTTAHMLSPREQTLHS